MTTMHFHLMYDFLKSGRRGKIHINGQLGCTVLLLLFTILPGLSQGIGNIEATVTYADTGKIELKRKFPTVATPEIQFYPEGGQIVAELINRIVVKSSAQNGIPIKVAGEIVNDEGNKVTHFSTEEHGLGMLLLIPENGKRYRAKYTTDKGVLYFELPAVAKKGSMLQMIEYPDYYQANIQFSSSPGDRTYTFTGQQWNQLIFRSEINSNKSGMVIKIPKAALDHGVVVFSLLDNSGSTVNQRQVYHLDPGIKLKTVNLHLTASRNSDRIDLEIIFEKLSKFTDMSLAIKPAHNKPFSGDAALTIGDLLSGDLKKRSNLDMLMITSNKIEVLKDSVHAIPGDMIHLKEVVIKSKRKDAKKQYSKRRFLYKNPSYTLDMNDISFAPHNTVQEILAGRIPGFSMGSFVLRGNTSLMENNSPMALLDGMPVQFEQLRDITVSEIEFIDVITGPKAAIYGSRVANGIIAVYTRTGETSNECPCHPARLKHNKAGISQSVTIGDEGSLAADYAGKAGEYWDPNIRANAEGNISVSFKASNEQQAYVVHLLGISEAGELVEVYQTFSVD